MVKIDVEGHEHAVIEGGRSTIERDRPFIIIEILGTAKFEVINTMLIEASYIDIALSPAALRHCLTLGFIQMPGIIFSAERKRLTRF
jgi:hypothetical protein